MASAKEKRALAQRRARAMGEMNPELRVQSTEIERLNDNELSETIHSHHKIGLICKTIQDNPEKFGANAIGLICDVHGVSKRVFQRNMRFVEYFPKQAELERLTDMVDDATGFRLQWAHIDYLLTITDNDALRWQFAEKAINELLTPKQLLAKIQKRLNRSGGHGRKHAIPKSLTGQVDQMLDMLKTLVQKSEEVWLGSGTGYSMWRTLNELADQGCSAELSLQLDDVLAKLEEVQAVLNQNAANAVRAKTHVTGALRRMEEAQASAAPEEEDAPPPQAPAVRHSRRRVSVA